MTIIFNDTAHKHHQFCKPIPLAFTQVYLTPVFIIPVYLPP